MSIFSPLYFCLIDPIMPYLILCTLLRLWRVSHI